MKLWLISQNVNNGYDTYDGAVVAAETAKEARNIYPGNFIPSDWKKVESSWTIPSKVKAKLLGEAKEGTKAGVILSSFNAG